MTRVRKQLIAGNWKMYRGGASGCELAAGIREGCRSIVGVDVVVAPPFTALAAVAHELDGSAVEVSGQNLYLNPEGAFTGEISAPMLLEAGCRWVIVGHSERRQYFGESDELVRDKALAAQNAGLRPIICIGETLQEREAGRTLEVVSRQLDAVTGVLAERAGFGVIAYEPVWAIGTGRVAGPEQAQEVHAAVRARLGKAGPELARLTRVLYGGSVKPDNARGLLECPDVDGALVGGASLEVESFLAIIRAAPSLP